MLIICMGGVMRLSKAKYKKALKVLADGGEINWDDYAKYLGDADRVTDFDADDAKRELERL
jgi:hypothetical protein